MKVATRPELFPCSELIGWILPRVDVTKMILENTKGQGYATYSPAYVAQAYKLPTPQIYLTEEWLKSLKLDVMDNMRKMMIPRKNFRNRPSGEYKTA